MQGNEEAEPVQEGMRKLLC
ncbi:hypothetical protein LINPERPRIM_LOCUS39355 [Linum perenne]